MLPSAGVCRSIRLASSSWRGGGLADGESGRALIGGGRAGLACL
ncbi:Uncharacterised protein [Bordetella pertussis]|nr:Uncharacterised protein [Bordetella pertussis]